MFLLVCALLHNLQDNYSSYTQGSDRIQSMQCSSLWKTMECWKSTIIVGAGQRECLSAENNDFSSLPCWLSFMPKCKTFFFNAPRKTSWAWHMNVQTTMALMATLQSSPEPRLRQSKEIYFCWKGVLLQLYEHIQLLCISFIHFFLSFI